MEGEAVATEGEAAEAGVAMEEAAVGGIALDHRVCLCVSLGLRAECLLCLCI